MTARNHSVIKAVSIKFVFLFSVLFLSACGGGGGGGSTTKVGVFTDSPVAGIRYTSPSHSGFTNELGEYNYEEGETVTFYLGDIELGSTVGAPEVTPFTLFDLIPPATEAEIKAELAKPVSDFHRVMNIVSLLVLLDKDGNPDNGIDVTGLESLLADADQYIDLGQNAFQFGNNLMYDLQDEGIITGNTSFEDPLLHFYNSLGIQITAKALKKTSRDNGDDGTINYVLENTFDADGRKTQRAENLDNDENIEYVSIYAYDANGNQTMNTTQNDGNDDGVIDQEYINDRTYDGDGRRLTQSNGRTGPTGYNYSYTYSYDADGNQTSYIQEYDNNNDGVDSRSTYTSTYNADGRILTEKNEEDSDADDTVDRITMYTYTYDANGNRLTRLQERNDNAASTTDINYVSTQTYTYDADNNRLTYTAETDNNNDETIDSKRTETYSYDANGNETGSVSSDDNDNDGTIDAVQTNMSSYDADGNQLSYSYSNDNDNDPNTPPSYEYSDINTFDTNGNQLTNIYVNTNNGEISYQNRRTYTYDSENRQTSYRTETDQDGDGTYDRDILQTTAYNAAGQAVMSTNKRNNSASDGTYESNEIQTATYNAAGVQTMFTYENDIDNDDTVDYVAAYVHTLDADGTITATTESIDEDNDGTVETTNVTTYEYETIADGLAYLLTNGLEDSVECSVNGNGGGRLLAGGGFIGSSNNYCQSGGYFFDD